MLRKPILPIQKQLLPDNLAKKIKDYIVSNHLEIGDRLPTIEELSNQFGVGKPTLREAIKKLETIGSIVVKHGSGIYVGKYINTLFLPNPIAITEPLSKRNLLALVDARLAIEGKIVSLAINNLAEKHFEKMRELLRRAKSQLDDFEKCGLEFLEFHYELQRAANNVVLYEITRAITNLYTNKQLDLINKHMSCEDDYELHCEIYRALVSRDERKSTELMESRLRLIRDIIQNYYPDDSE
jgi:GntR family transcriptional repressor for pyruvate dehydrogenase complex